jgi:hypothetical protein
MPQLDLFTIQTQFICLIVSIFVIYSFYLKYAISSFDAFKRLKVKKFNYFRTQNALLSFFSLMLKKKTVEYISYMSEGISDISKIVTKKIFHNLTPWYLENSIIRIIKHNIDNKINEITVKLYIVDLLTDIVVKEIQKIEENQVDEIEIAKQSENLINLLKILKLKKDELEFSRSEIIRAHILDSFKYVDAKKSKKNLIELFKFPKIKYNSNSSKTNE